MPQGMALPARVWPAPAASRPAAGVDEQPSGQQCDRAQGVRRLVAPDRPGAHSQGNGAACSRLQRG
jgi:hypothetical protein